MFVLTCDLTTSLLLGVRYPTAILVPDGPFILVRPHEEQMMGVWPLDPELVQEAGHWPIRGGGRQRLG
jgi:hypothetical protein